jgi:hypothetical protein
VDDAYVLPERDVSQYVSRKDGYAASGSHSHLECGARAEVALRGVQPDEVRATDRLQVLAFDLGGQHVALVLGEDEAVLFVDEFEVARREDLAIGEERTLVATERCESASKGAGENNA